MKRNNIACLSVGKHALKNIIPAIKQLRSYNLVGIYNRNKKKSKILSDDLNCKKYLSIKELLEDKKIDTVYISSPPSLHYTHARKVLSVNKNVIVEKPLTINIVQSRKLIRLAREKNLAIIEAFMYRFHDQFRKLEKIIKNEKKSDLKMIEATFGIPKLDKNNIRYNKTLGGGALFDVGVYPITLINMLFGHRINIINSNYKFSKKYEVDLYGKIKINLNSNKIAVLSWYIGGIYKNFIKLNYKNNKYNINFSFSKNNRQNVNIIKNRCGNKFIIKVNTKNHFVEMLNYFNEVIKNEKLKKQEYYNICSQSLLLDLVIKDKKKKLLQNN